MAKKILLSCLSGLIIMLITWMYQNYDFSFSIEDAFLKKIFLWKDKIYSSPPEKKAEFVFINTGKDLALVEDTVEFGNVAISDREKIYRLVHYMDSLPKKPAFTVLDIQFYYPYSVNPAIDSLLEKALAKNDRVVIPVVVDKEGDYKNPLYNTKYAYSNYRTYGSVFNKFRIMNQGDVMSIPIILDERVNNAVYKDHFLYPTCNGRFCLSAIWPSYYLKNSDIVGLFNETDLKKIKTSAAGKKEEDKVKAEYYNIGEILYDIEGSPEKYQTYFDKKIVILGNFEEDIHTTPVGKMAGPVLLTNIYLSLLNDQHIISFGLFLLLWMVFSGLSYVAWYKKMPEFRWDFRFIFASFVIKFIKKYITYFGCMFLVSLIVLIVFNVQVALFLPSFIFTAIEYVRQKKYMDLLKTKRDE